MRFRTTTVAALVAIVIAVASGCTSPSPTATPTPTFTTAAQAYAAAEKTYRAYVDALNAVDLSDPKTFEAVYAWTTGDALAGVKKSFSEMHAKSLRVSGKTRVALVAPSSIDSTRTRVVLDVCEDVSAVNLLDPSGKSVVDTDRVDIQTIRVSLVHAGRSPTRMLISTFRGREEGPKCD